MLAVSILKAIDNFYSGTKVKLFVIFQSRESVMKVSCLFNSFLVSTLIRFLNSFLFSTFIRGYYKCEQFAIATVFLVFYSNPFFVYCSQLYFRLRSKYERRQMVEMFASYCFKPYTHFVCSSNLNYYFRQFRHLTIILIFNFSLVTAINSKVI